MGLSLMVIAHMEPKENLKHIVKGMGRITTEF